MTVQGGKWKTTKILKKITAANTFDELIDYIVDSNDITHTRYFTQDGNNYIEVQHNTYDTSWGEGYVVQIKKDAEEYEMVQAAALNYQDPTEEGQYSTTHEFTGRFIHILNT